MFSIIYTCVLMYMREGGRVGEREGGKGGREGECEGDGWRSTSIPVLCVQLKDTYTCT